jgi:hypothetical protein
MDLTRAQASLKAARLGAEQSGRKEATRCSPQSYDCFTEGFDTKDLQEAKARLTALERTDAHV